MTQCALCISLPHSLNIWRTTNRLHDPLTLYITLQMSNSAPCDLEAGMRSLSISSPAKPEEITASDQEAVLDSVFVDGDPVEERQGDVHQQERLDSTDALLLDATSKMDDTAFLDEVIARNCQSSVSADEDYIDEVIARCFYFSNN